jgi:hypothetical protein
MLLIKKSVNCFCLIGAFLDIHQFWKNVPKAPGYEEFQNSHKKYTSNGDQNILKCYFKVDINLAFDSNKAEFKLRESVS